MTVFPRRETIAPIDIVSFLASHELHATEVSRYPDGVASENFRATGPGGLDLTVRCDFRRALDMVRQDRRYADLARHHGISVPSGKWIDGHIRDVPATARATIVGTSLAHLSPSELPTPDQIGELLAALHKVAPPRDDRRFFYEGLLDASHPIWFTIQQAYAAFSDDAGISYLMKKALERVRRHASGLRTVTKMSLTMIHGDFNPPNILKSGNGLVLIDWEKACAGYCVADLVQAIYYFSAAYGRHGLAFTGDFMQAYAKTHGISRSILDVWLRCFPAFIFLRDTVSASLQSLGRMSCAQARSHAYLRDDSAPRFRYFLENEQAIREAVLN